MNQQRGYIDLGGFFVVIGVLAIFGVWGFVSAANMLWQWAKPLIHAAIG